MKNEWLPEIREQETCPKCELVMDGYIVHKEDGLCPRCCYEIDDTIDMEITDVVSEDQKGAGEFCDLILILNNWCDGYLRLVTESGVDWSLPHEFLEDFTDQMCPYIARLQSLGYANSDRMLQVGDIVKDCIAKIISALEQEEYLLRLTGRWDDKEEKIKEYWQERIGSSFKVLGYSRMAEDAPVGIEED